MQTIADTRRPVLATAAWPAQGTVRWVVRGLVLALFGTLLLTLSAKVQVPFWPVPMTMQTLVVLLIGMGYGWRLGTATLLLYLLEGSLGLPVFAGTPERGIGLSYMVGSTGGYLVGFVISAALVGLLAERGWDRGILKPAGALLLGHAVTFLFGVAWLSVSLGLDKAMSVGLYPFWLATLLKVALGTAIVPLAWRALDAAAPPR